MGMRFQLRHGFSSIALLALVFTLLCPALNAGGLMHCFVFTPIADAGSADWKAFYEATAALPDKIDGLHKAWAGKLRRPVRQYGRNGGDPLVREYGVCMEMEDEAALAAYADHPAHTEWVKIYSKVREPGTLTYDMLVESPTGQ